MSRKIRFHFKEDLGKPQFVPHYVFHADHTLIIGSCILDRTENYDLAVDVAGWAELAAVGQSYDNNIIHAEIIDE